MQQMSCFPRLQAAWNMQSSSEDPGYNIEATERSDGWLRVMYKDSDGKKLPASDSGFASNAPAIVCARGLEYF